MNYQTKNMKLRIIWFCLAILTCLSGRADETLGIPFISDASQLSSNASDKDEGKHLEYLIDGNSSTFWHTDWHNQVSDDHHYLQIELKEPYQGDMKIYMLRRDTDNDHPTEMIVEASNDAKSWTSIATVSLPFEGARTPTYSKSFNLSQDYKYIRVAASNCTGKSNYGFRIFWHAAEFQLYPVYADSPFIPTRLEDGSLSSQTTYYTMTIRGDKKIYMDGSSLRCSNSGDITPAHLWAFTGNSTEGYRVYNYSTGATSWASLSSSENKTYVKMVTKTPSNGTDAFMLSTNQNGGYNFYFPELNNSCWNDFNNENVIATWNHSNASRDNGSNIVFEEYDVEMLNKNTAEQYHILWDQANQAYKEALGSESHKLITDASQLSSNASDWQEGLHIEYLIDGDEYTFWHSDWHNIVTEPHYIQVDTPSDPAEGSIVIDVIRRHTDRNHVTLMSVQGSNDNENWTFISNVELGNAYEGAAFTSNPISLGGNSYKYLRFYILSNTTDRAFGHFAEFQVYELKEFGDNYILDMGGIATFLNLLLKEGENITDDDITEDMVTELQQTYLAFVDKLNELKSLPNAVASLNQLRQGVTYSIRGRYDEGYLVYNPTITDKWVSILGAQNESYNTIANEAYRVMPDLNEVRNVWQFVEYDGEWYLYNQEAKRYLYTDGMSAYQLISTPTPIHLVQIEEGIFALNTVSNDATNACYASINLSKEVKPLQCSTIDNHGAQFILEKTSPKAIQVDIKSSLYSMRLPESMAQLTNVPTIYINTFDGYSITSKSTYKYANLWRVDGETIDRYDSLQIRGRGNSTWQLAKKPYRIKFKEKERFLGRDYANARNWTLMANHADKTLIRNAVANFIGKELGQTFTPASSFVDLYINDNYLGNYQVSDHVDIRKKRIDITEQEEIPTENSDISGGYFMEIIPSSTSEPAWFSTEKGTNITIKSPDSDVLTYAQQAYITNHVSEFENRLFSTKYKDKDEGYRPMVDSLSLASWFLATEFTGNADGYYSIYFYKDAQDDKLYFGPLWDFDIAFNNCDRIGEVTNRMMIDAGFDGGGRKWPTRMWKDPWFRNLAGRMWHKCVEEGMVERTLHFVDSLAEVIDKSQEKNFEIWPLDSHVYNEITLYSTYQEGIDYLKKFITEHAEYLNSIMPKESQQGGDDDKKLEINDSYYYRIYNKGNNMAVDVTGDDNTKVCVWTTSEDRKETQQWYLKHIEDGYYQILSRSSNLAITDMAAESNGNYYRGSNLALKEVEEGNDRQLWHPVMVDDTYLYFENRETDMAWNNSGGGRTNGNGILSWTNDEDNANKATRLWTIEQADERLVQSIAEAKNDLEYRITYNPATQKIHIRIPSGTNEIPNSKITVYDLSGKQMLEEGTIQESIDVSSLRKGVYLLRWTIGEKSKSIKFLKQ